MMIDVRHSAEMDLIDDCSTGSISSCSRGFPWGERVDESFDTSESQYPVRPGRTGSTLQQIRVRSYRACRITG